MGAWMNKVSRGLEDDVGYTSSTPHIEMRSKRAKSKKTSETIKIRNSQNKVQAAMHRLAKTNRNLER